ncbi:MAG: hypothetical protein JWO50_604 [Candidatus Kaiserbacteria bacterium]|nr:hypothetical protein [Candidatus Kaiserbacteria bacterium]
MTISKNTYIASLFLATLFALLGLVFATSVGAQVIGSQTSSSVGTLIAPQQQRCFNFTRNLYVGTRDQSTAGEVTNLQNFLASQGYFSQGATGYFGALTMRAVMNFQRDNGVSSTGYVGVQTRAHMAAKYCNYPQAGVVQLQYVSPNTGPVGATVTIHGSGFTSDNTILFGGGAIVHAVSNDGSTLTFTVPSSLDPACRFTSPMCAVLSRQTTPGDYQVSVQNANGTSNAVSFTVTNDTTTQTPVTIYSITPTQGPVGTTINIRGFGFTSNNTVHFGAGAFGNIPITSSIAIACTTDPTCHGGINQTLTITVPSSIGPYCPPNSMCAMYMQLITPGTYTIYVQNENGTSNSVTFTVTGGSTSNTGPSISGIDAPTTLALGTQGTWTVHTATMSNATSNLHYSVVWGDENNMAASQIMAPAPTTVQTSATFTHAYSRSGIYTPMFTVTDDNGRSATVSATVNVTPLY